MRKVGLFFIGDECLEIENTQILKPITMTDTFKSVPEIKTRKSKTPRNSESITKGALALPLKERCKLVEDLRTSIQAEVETINAAAKEASAIANGLG